MPFGLKNAGATYQRVMNTIFHEYIEKFMQVYIDDIVVKSKSQDVHIEHLKLSFEKMRKYGLKMNPLKCAFGVIAGQFLGFIVHKKGIEIDQNKAKAIFDTQPPSNKKQLQSLLGKVNFLRRFIMDLSGKTKVFSTLLRLKKEQEFQWMEEHQKAFEEIKASLTTAPVMAPLIRGKPMKLYISASEETIGSVLAQDDEDGIERAIYYLSRILNDAETRYSLVEKLCLCLYFSCTKLKYYIKPIDVTVISHYDIIKHMLFKPILHSRIGKWALALTEFSLSYQHLRAMKGQVIADFLVDHSGSKEQETVVTLKPWEMYFDGSRHKKGTGIGILVISPQGIPTKIKLGIEGECSNNEAEYEALLIGLETALNLGARELLIRGDSELVIKQLTGEYQCVSENLMKYHSKAVKMLRSFDEVELCHIPRIENAEANVLAQIASGYRLPRKKFKELVKVKRKFIPSFKERKVEFEQEVLVISNLDDSDWRKPVVKYLQNPNAPIDRRTKYRALSYLILDDELFKKGVNEVLLKCLSEEEAFRAVKAVHDGMCGAHQAGHKMKWTLFRQGVYWPSMLKDCIEYAKSCAECQKHAGIQHVPASELHSIVKPWPFRGWALDLIGQIHPSSSKQHDYIIVAIDYFTKWVEAIPLRGVDQDTVISFIQEHIVFRYGIPETLTTDQGSVFTGRKMAQFAEDFGIKLLTSTPYYAQANGQVEAANKVLINLVKKHISQKPRRWHETLSQVLWAYRNSPKEATGVTPFRLTYGHESVLPIEICLQSVRIQRQFEIPCDDYWNMMYDELIELDEERLNALEVMIRQKERITKSYNKKVKFKAFSVGDLVWKVILPMDKKDRAYGKWAPKWEGPFKVIKCYSNNAYSIEEIGTIARILTINGKYLKRFKPAIHEIKIDIEM
ncbi:uncharacterized protein LOC130724933 [Lotus japonicus]|uniref:uncharacterized protein LOC130724933 n=1 Tax=Lotus japonicus TaxID=34305 RepID=UPI00258BB8D4|nr:uncharacterized protein LOC130724933 [Lotus japonicus]